MYIIFIKSFLFFSRIVTLKQKRNNASIINENLGLLQTLESTSWYHIKSFIKINILLKLSKSLGSIETYKTSSAAEFKNKHFYTLLHCRLKMKFKNKFMNKWHTFFQIFG